MINLHQKYNHYLHTNKLLDHQDVHEKVTSYGWTDNGKDLTGYYIITENWVMHFDLSEKFISKEKLTSGIR
jgi:hypothetical protein